MKANGFECLVESSSKLIGSKLSAESLAVPRIELLERSFMMKWVSGRLGSGEYVAPWRWRYPNEIKFVGIFFE